MIRGLVIGKFMPVHIGHLALIRFAASKCDELIVSMTYTPSDPIDFAIRFFWLKEIFKDEPSIRPEFSEDNFDDPDLPLADRTLLWAEFINKRFPRIDLLFSSEEYGDPFALQLGISHVEYDRPRSITPVSATLIRDNPFRYWDYIPDVVKPYFVKKICFYGPESTGKSTLAAHFANVWKTEFVPEVAREMLITNDFTVDDIIRIGIAQTDRIKQKTVKANKFLFCDTDLITTEIYAKHYLNIVPPILRDLEKEITYDLYFLLEIDVPWVADGLRDLGNRRDEMALIFREELEKRNISYVVVRGTWDARIQIVDRELGRFFEKSI